MENAQKFMELQTAANRATDAWLADSSEANHSAMCAADDALQAAKAAGWNKIQLPEAVVAGMMDRSVFGTVDRQHAAVDQAPANPQLAAYAPAAARVTAADLAIQRGITGRIRAGALAELENLVDPSVDLPIYHDAEFLRAEILRITSQARADIEAAKAEYLARAA